MWRRGRQCGRTSTNLLLIRYTTCVLTSAAFFSRCVFFLNFVFFFYIFDKGFWFLFFPVFVLYLIRWGVLISHSFGGWCVFCDTVSYCLYIQDCSFVFCQRFNIVWGGSLCSFMLVLDLIGGTNYWEAGFGAGCLGEKVSHTVWSGPCYSIPCDQGCDWEGIGSKYWWSFWKIWCRSSWFCFNRTGILQLHPVMKASFSRC